MKQSEFYDAQQGAVNEARGLEFLIPAMQHVDAQLHIYGDGNYFAQTQQLINQNNLTNKVFLKGKVLPTELEQVTLEATIGINLVENKGLNQYYSLANKFFDYICVGLPVLNNYPGWISELITQYNCGITVSPDNPVAFADSLIKLEQEKYKLPEMSVNARNLAENEFDRILLSDKWVDWVTS